jgi:hypothetical protein
MTHPAFIGTLSANQFASDKEMLEFTPDQLEQQRQVRLHQIAPQLLAALEAAEPALAEGDENCGGDGDSLYHEPLQLVRAALALVNSR